MSTFLTVSDGVQENGSFHFGPLLQELATKHRVPAAQLAMHVDGVTSIYVASGTGEMVRTDDKIPVGSITKAFTAAVALLLVADGDLSLDDLVGEHLRELRDRPTGMLAVRQLLSHTSGLPASTGQEGFASVRQYLKVCRDLRLVQQPGAGFSYSNVGYVLIGQIVARLTGMSWAEAVETLLLRPMDVTPSFVVGGTGGFLPGHAVGDQVRKVRQTLNEVQAPAGALALSAGDLVAFGLDHLRPDPEELRWMRWPVPDVDPFGLADGWGLGLAVFGDPAGDWFGHDGTADGTSCHLRIDPARNRVVALTTNANTGATLWADLVRELRAAGVPVGDYDLRPLSQPVPPPRGLSGHYTNGDLEYQVRIPESRSPVLVVDGEVFPELVVHRDDRFSVREPASGRRVIGGRFLRDPATGEVSALQTGGRVAPRRDFAR